MDDAQKAVWSLPTHAVVCYNLVIEILFITVIELHWK